LLGIPEGEWRLLAADSATVGLAMGVRIRADLPRIEAALANLFGYADALIAARRRSPRPAQWPSGRAQSVCTAGCQ